MGESSRRHADSSDEEDDAEWLRPSAPRGRSDDEEDEFGVSLKIAVITSDNAEDVPGLPDDELRPCT
jgi:hypothetical protein